MADKKKMSVEEILAAARATDGGGGSKPQASSEAAADASQGSAADAPAKPAPAKAAPAKSSGGEAKKATPSSVADILAAARAEKAGGAAATAPAAAEEGAAQEAAAPAKPAKPAGQMSVAEMLAAARGEKSKPAAKPAAAPAKPAAEKASPKAPAKTDKPAAKESAPVASGPKDTTSILTAARQGAKPGPVSKAEAAAKAQPATGKKAVVVPPMPERPGYLQPAEPVVADETRRTFFASFVGVLFGSSLAVGFSSLVVTNLLWVLGLARFMFPNILTEPPTVFKVGFPADYGPGQVETKYVAQFGVWVVRYEYNGQQQIYALRTVCTHLGCTPNWLEGEQKFKCPCHGSGFYKDGINFEGPAPRPLERYAVRLADDGQIEVDKSRKFNEELGQWKDGSSFVTV